MEKRETLLKIVIYLIYSHWAEGKKCESWRFGIEYKEKLFPHSPWPHLASLLPSLSYYLDKHTWPHLLILLNICLNERDKGKLKEELSLPSVHHAINRQANQVFTIPIPCWRDETITPAAPSGVPIVFSYSKPTMHNLRWVGFELKFL